MSQQGQEEKIITTFCHGCGSYKTHCGVLCYVENARFVRVEGNPHAFNNWGKGCASLCAKGYTGPQYVYAPDRVKYPLKRVGEKGDGKFQRITWDEALDTIADKLKEVKAKYGPEAYGVLSPEFSPVLNSLGRRFLNIYGSPNFLHSAICFTPHEAAARSTIGFYPMAPDDWLKTKLIVNWGSNVENSGVNTGQLNAILNALSNGTKLIDIRPMLDPLATKADIWLPIRPGTDCALALAFLNVIIEEKLYDTSFVNDWCYGFDKLSEHVRKFLPEWAAEKTGIPDDRIKEAARLIATIKPVFIKTGNGIGDQTIDGSSTTSAICLIAAITGNIDIPGGLVFKSHTIFPVYANNLEEMAPPNMLDKLVAPESPKWYQTKDNWETGPSSAYYKGLMSILTSKPYPLRMLNSSNTNPLSATRNPKKVAEALKKVDFLFAADTFWAPHLNFADIVLPSSTVYEQSDYFGVKRTDEGSWISIFNKVVEPLGESRSDWQIYLDLAVKMGYGEYFWQGNAETYLNEQLAGFGLTAEQLRQNPNGILIKRKQPSPPLSYRKYSIIFKNLPHGKVQCYNEFLGGKENNEGSGKLPYLPVYKGPPEGIAETPELVKEYPLILSDVHAHRLSQHSFMHNVPYLRELQPYPWIKINPATAKKYGIENGDWVKVESLYGWCKFKAEYFEGISLEVLMTKCGWNQPCNELSLPGYSVFNGGSEVNNLYNTDEKLFDKFFSQMAKQTLVKISRCEKD